jgi:hypothetical protein
MLAALRTAALGATPRRAHILWTGLTDSFRLTKPFLPLPA